jgi:UDP-N-acetylglucosamine 2-epimerase (non-hydrolysing)/UDP-GlcNAc3NAcA epimerase
MKVATVVGARPQFIKAAPVSRALRRNHTEILIHTGQHYDENMSDVFFDELEIPAPEYHLGIGSGDHGSQTGAMLAAIEKVLQEEQPDWTLVYGDTNSTLAGALASAKLHIPVAHVEAGLRSFNRRMPEEINRVLADHISDLLLCPSETARDHLAAEGIRQGVHVVGDVMADALMFAAQAARHKSSILERLELVPKKYLLATVHRAENTDDPTRLRNILTAFGDMDEPVVFPIHPRTRRVLEQQNYTQYAYANICIIDPVGYLDMVRLELSARMILTDSGGIQKEAYWLSVPCVTLREETEWVETISVGWNQLVGADTRSIITAARNFKPPEYHPPLYGDGKTSERVVELLNRASFDTHSLL